MTKRINIFKNSAHFFKCAEFFCFLRITVGYSEKLYADILLCEGWSLRELYFRSDLAAEAADYSLTAHREIDGIKIEEAVFNDGKRAVSFYMDKPWLWCDRETARAAELVGDMLRAMLEAVTRKKLDGSFRALLVGLGNRYITADSIGVKVAERVTVSENLARSAVDRDTGYEGFGRLSVLIPGTLAQTGVESADIIGATARSASADAVIAVDALAAASLSHLGGVIQLTDCGIAPGSGIRNSRVAINDITVGCPVISIGVPTVTDSAALIYDALSAAEVDDIPPKLETVIENGRGYFVTVGEADMITEELARVIALAVDNVFFMH